VIVLDSSFLLAYHNSTDVHHPAAARTMVRLLGGEWGRALLLEYVFLEVVTVVLARRGAALASEVAGQLLAAAELEFVPCSPLFAETLHQFRAQVDRRLSFTDAAIVAVATRQAPGYVATFDADFTAVDGVTVVPG